MARKGEVAAKTGIEKHILFDIGAVISDKFEADANVQVLINGSGKHLFSQAPSAANPRRSAFANPHGIKNFIGMTGAKQVNRRREAGADFVILAVHFNRKDFPVILRRVQRGAEFGFVNVPAAPTAYLFFFFLTKHRFIPRIKTFYTSLYTIFAARNGGADSCCIIKESGTQGIAPERIETVNIRQRPIRVYAETTVFGGIVDIEFETASRAFFEEVRNGRFALVIAAPVEDEIADAPLKVQNLFQEMVAYAEVVLVTDEARALQAEYLSAGILTAKSATDALHVATASVADCELIVSWNFNHIVRYSKIQRFNAVNALYGYRSVAIHSPLEVIKDGE